MKVNGYEVPPAVVEACLSRMHRPELGLFRAADISALAEAVLICKAGVDSDDLDDSPLGDRIADRLIQRERLAGRIKSVKYPYWEPVVKGK